ncbi:hypothetical protein ABPG72_021630 [Tetrahymena utriculariae]
MKLDSKNIISQQSQSQQFPINSSQETQPSSYKTIKKKILTKQKLSASGSTQFTDSSSYKKSAKLSKAKDLTKKIDFDDCHSQQLEFNRIQMDTFSQESHHPLEMRTVDTQSQNFGYCHSQFEDIDETNNNQNQAILENENQYQTRPLIYQNEQNSNSRMFQQANYDLISVQQYSQSIDIGSRNVQNIQGLSINVAQREMIAESTSIQSLNQANNNNNVQSGFFIQRSESRRSEESMEYNDENAMQTSQQQIRNNTNRSERRLLGEITQQLRPLQSPQLEEEFQFNNNNQLESQEEEQDQANLRAQQNQFIQEDNHGSLFYPNDDLNFIENDEYGYEQYNISSQNYNNIDDSRNGFQFFEANNSQQFQRLQSQSQRNLTIKEMLEEFKQEDTFSFDDQDLQNFENRQTDYMVDPLILKEYSSNFTNFSKKRSILIDWMQEVSTGFSFKRETYQQSISIIDRYFERVPQVPKNQLQLVGATALLIAHKIEEVMCKKNDEFITICNGGYTNSQFIQMEIDICLKLKFELNTPTPYFIMNQLMLRWDGLAEQYKELFDNDIIFFKKNNQRSFLLFSKVCQYIDCSYYSIHIYNYPIKYVITLFMYSSLYGSLLQSRDSEVKLNHLNQLFEYFIQNTLNLESNNDLQNVKNFTDQFMELIICDKVPTTNQYMNRQDDQIYESYENVCSQQLYNRDFKRLFSIGD